ncbi:hypothetical protein GCM10009111_02860 [Colwellia asteriadis]|uniref:DUF4279 domain-containing protein n=1 Tax=Colwellia asteriadis TaxID=517723 RepID=A0ABN1L2Q6_9GAMM
MACTFTYATLRIFSSELSPEKITDLIGFNPTKVKAINHDSKYKHEREFNYWAFSTKNLSDSTDNVEHLEIILNNLQDKLEVMCNLHKLNCSTDIFCFWDSNGQGGPSMTVDLMNRLVSLNLNISWDIYFDDESA